MIYSNALPFGIDYYVRRSTLTGSMVHGLVVAPFDKWILWYRFRPTFDSRDRDPVFIAPKFIAINLFLIICIQLRIEFISWNSLLHSNSANSRQTRHPNGLQLWWCRYDIMWHSNKKMEPKVSGPSVYVLWHHHHQRDERIYLNRKTSIRPFGELAFRVRAKIVKRTNMWVQVVCASQCFTYKNLLELLEMRCNMNSISIPAVNSSFNTVWQRRQCQNTEIDHWLCASAGFCITIFASVPANGRVGSLVHCLNK